MNPCALGINSALNVLQANYRLKRSNGDTESLVRLRSVLYHNKAIECDTQSFRQVQVQFTRHCRSAWAVVCPGAPSSKTANIVQDVGEGVIVRMRLSATSGNDARYVINRSFKDLACNR